ncbi:MAG: hypothetical protein WCT18_00705 [Patescibacteria group bacterium]
MLNFIFHSQFQKDAESLKRRFPFFDSGLESFKKICQVHFDSINPRQVIAPGKLHRVKCLENFTIWKVELAIKNLRANQFPRIWFLVKNDTINFLCIKTHIDNYDNNEIDRKAEVLALENLI